MINTIKIYGPVILLAITVVSAGAQSNRPNQPIDVIRNAIDGAAAIMKDPQYKDGTQTENLRQAVWNAIKDVFDYYEISRRSLARNWKKFSPDQKKEFTRVFTEFLKSNYLNRLKGEYDDATITYGGQELVSETKATVKTTFKRQTVEVAVDYRMRLRNNHWRIYDVYIEGVSMIKNYRSQFNEILAKESPDQLIDRLNKKIQQQEAGSEKS